MLMTKDNAMSVLEKELSNYRRYSALIKVSKENYRKYEEQALNVRSPLMDRIGDNTCALPFDLMEVVRLRDLEQEKMEAYIDMQNWIIDIIHSVESRSLRPDIVRIYLRGEERKVVASERGIRYKLFNDQVRKALKISVTEKRIAKYNEVRKRIDAIEKVWF